MPNICPHCFATFRKVQDLSIHLRFECPVIRPKESFDKQVSKMLTNFMEAK